MDYNDKSVFTEYIWKNYQGLIDRETNYLKVLRALMRTMGMSIPKEPFPNESKQYEDLELDELRKIIHSLETENRTKIASEVYEKHKDEIFINRCEKCNRIVIAPGSEQCLHCGHQWLGTNPYRKKS